MQLETWDCWIYLYPTLYTAHLELLSSFLNVTLFSEDDKSSRICHGRTQVSLWGLFTYRVYLLKKASLNWTPTNPIQTSLICWLFSAKKKKKFLKINKIWKANMLTLTSLKNVGVFFFLFCFEIILIFAVELHFRKRLRTPFIGIFCSARKLLVCFTFQHE